MESLICPNDIIVASFGTGSLERSIPNIEVLFDGTDVTTNYIAKAKLYLNNAGGN